jgi:hypothetical protein
VAVDVGLPFYEPPGMQPQGASAWNWLRSRQVQPWGHTVVLTLQATALQKPAAVPCWKQVSDGATQSALLLQTAPKLPGAALGIGLQDPFTYVVVLSQGASTSQPAAGRSAAAAISTKMSLRRMVGS